MVSINIGILFFKYLDNSFAAHSIPLELTAITIKSILFNISFSRFLNLENFTFLDIDVFSAGCFFSEFWGMTWGIIWGLNNFGG